MTIGIDYGVVKCENVSISIFDVGGHELFREVRQEFYADTEAVLLVFDARDVHPITSLQRWVKEFTKYGGKIDQSLGMGYLYSLHIFRKLFFIYSSRINSNDDSSELYLEIKVSL